MDGVHYDDIGPQHQFRQVGVVEHAGEPGRGLIAHEPIRTQGEDALEGGGRPLPQQLLLRRTGVDLDQPVPQRPVEGYPHALGQARHSLPCLEVAHQQRAHLHDVFGPGAQVLQDLLLGPVQLQVGTVRAPLQVHRQLDGGVHEGPLLHLHDAGHMLPAVLVGELRQDIHRAIFPSLKVHGAAEPGTGSQHPDEEAPHLLQNDAVHRIWQAHQVVVQGPQLPEDALHRRDRARFLLRIGGLEP